MNISSTILTVGTALRHAEDGGARVHILLGGTWMIGTVVGVDSEGVVLQSADGDVTVVRLQAVNAVRVEQVSPDPRPAPAPDEHRRGDRSPRPGWHAGGADRAAGHTDLAEELLTRELAALRRERQPA